MAQNKWRSTLTGWGLPPPSEAPPPPDGSDEIQEDESELPPAPELPRPPVRRPIETPRRIWPRAPTGTMLKPPGKETLADEAVRFDEVERRLKQRRLESLEQRRRLNLRHHALSIFTGFLLSCVLFLAVWLIFRP